MPTLKLVAKSSTFVLPCQEERSPKTLSSALTAQFSAKNNFRANGIVVILLYLLNPEFLILLIYLGGRMSNVTLVQPSIS